ncbi:MAG: hypothetical protein LUF34_09305 [Lachnospiraceae bacterium]|nr:hypothetical protein [Lachnospiraceae bacterium]
MSEGLTDEEIQEIIGSYARIQEELRARIDSARSELLLLNEKIYSYAVWENRIVSETPLGRREEDRMVRILERAEQDRRRFTRDLTECLERLEAECARNQRIYLGYQSLPAAEYRVLYKLYEEKVPWRSLHTEMHAAPATVRALRHAGLNHIRMSCEACREKEEDAERHGSSAGAKKEDLMKRTGRRSGKWT